MRHCCRQGTRTALIAALAAVFALLLLPAVVTANGAMPSAPPVAPPAVEEEVPVIVEEEIVEEAEIEPAQPAMIGAGGAPMGFASNAGNTAYINVCDFATTAPVRTTGTIQMNVVDAVAAGQPASENVANVTASFVHPQDNATYTVRFTGLQPMGSTPAVGFLTTVCGSLGPGSPVLPRTLVYMYATGLATIARDGQTIATNQPAMALVTQGVHGPNQQWLGTAEPDGREIHLVVPGPLMPGGTAVEGFQNGFFYVYWPEAAFDLRNIGGAVAGSTGAAATTGQSTVTRRETVTTTTTPPAGRGPVGSDVVRNLTITLNSGGIATSGDTEPGPYVVTVRNNSSVGRGLVMQGIDKCCAPYTRFTRELAPGASTQFRWYFPPGPVTIRDVLDARKVPTAYANVELGGHSTTVTFAD